MIGQCDARFGAKETLNRHLLTHTCAKPHVCPHCAKGFIQPAQLKAHLLQHQSVRPSNVSTPVFTEFYRVLLGFTELQPYFTGFYQVLLGFTGFD